MSETLRWLYLLFQSGFYWSDRNKSNNNSSSNNSSSVYLKIEIKCKSSYVPARYTVITSESVCSVGAHNTSSCKEPWFNGLTTWYHSLRESVLHTKEPKCHRWEFMKEQSEALTKEFSGLIWVFMFELFLSQARPLSIITSSFSSSYLSFWYPLKNKHGQTFVSSMLLY